MRKLRQPTRVLWLLEVLLLVVGIPAAGAARPEGNPGAAATHSALGSILAPVRAVEERAVVPLQKRIAERSGIHIAAGIIKSWMYNFNDPASGINTLHSLDPDHGSAELDFAQIAATREPRRLLVPGFGLKLGFGRAAKRFKADWDGDGALNPGDTFEKNSFEVEEAYLEWKVPQDLPVLGGLSLKGGKFVTLLGAEVIEPWANQNFSRSFLFGLAIPFTHTGALLTYPLGDKLSASAGLVVGWDNVGDNNDSPSGLGSISYAPSDKLTLSVNGIYGPEQTGRIGPKRGVVDIVATLRPAGGLELLVNYDWGHESEIVRGTRPATWQGFALVASHALGKRTSVSVRAEWFDDSDGVRTGMRQHLWETTLTGRYLLTEHLYARLEYRHDESSRRAFAAGQGKLLSGQDILGFAFGYVFE